MTTQYVTTQPMQAVQPVQVPMTIVSQPAPPSKDEFSASSRSQITVLSSIQVAMGSLCLIFGITFAVIDSKDFNFGHYVGRFGYGIWIGAYFTVCGGIGLGATKHNKSGWIIATMVLNIVCTVLWCWTLVGFSTAGLVLNGIFNSCYDSYYYGHTDGDCTMTKTYYALDGMMLIMAVIQFVITIWCACLCCGAVCECCKNPTSTTTIQMSNPMYPGTSGTINTSYSAGQPVYTVQQGYPVGVHQAQVGGYMIPQQQYQHQLMQQPPSYSAAPYQAHALPVKQM